LLALGVAAWRPDRRGAARANGSTRAFVGAPLLQAPGISDCVIAPGTRVNAPAFAARTPPSLRILAGRFAARSNRAPSSLSPISPRTIMPISHAARSNSG